LTVAAFKNIFLTITPDGTFYFFLYRRSLISIKFSIISSVQKILENPEALQTAVPGKPKLQIKRPVEAQDDDDNDDGGCC
jgi:hypothetical protein